VPEVAGRYQVSERTVYRWYKSGRLKPVKIGREWLLPDDGQVAPLPSDGLMWRGHVLALVNNLEQAGALQEEVLAAGRKWGGRLFRGQWRGGVKPPDVDLGNAYVGGGPAAVLDIWRHEAAAARREGRPLCALSDPPPRDFHPPEALLDYEIAANEIDLDDGGIVCLYQCSDLTGPQLTRLLYVHEALYLPFEGGWREFRRT